MAAQATLNDIARADASPAQARQTLLAIFGQPTPDLLRDAYIALRAWTWKALDQRRRDAELRDWTDIIGAASSLMVKHGQPLLGQRLTALNELISESVAVGERHEVLDVTRRQHVAETLAFLAQNGGRTNRVAIGERLGLAQANLTRVLNLMLAAGLLERTTHGKEAIFALSRAGMDASKGMRAAA
jgi:hypothetical protein